VIETTDVLDDVPVSAIHRLLVGARLPTADVAPGPRQRFLAVRTNGNWCGIVAVEPMGDVALLRSLAVAPAMRSQGMGRKLVGAAEALAQSMGARAIYLLTTDAAPYFARLGFAPIARDEVPTAVRGSTQFASICPASATVMRKLLPQPLHRP
jgi:N-acetylglutamate synthase-like GNAT family acetyltransferase